MKHTLASTQSSGFIICSGAPHLGYVISGYLTPMASGTATRGGASPVPGLCEAEWIEVVNKVALNHKQKSFDVFGSDDIQQEVWIIALKAVPAFKMPKAKVASLPKAVEHWLNRVVSTRLTNLYRDRFAIKAKALKKDKSTLDKETRQRLVSATSLDNSAYGVADHSVEDGIDAMAQGEQFDALFKALSACGAETFASIAAGETIPSYYRSRLITEIKAIVQESSNEEIE